MIQTPKQFAEMSLAVALLLDSKTSSTPPRGRDTGRDLQYS